MGRGIGYLGKTSLIVAIVLAVVVFTLHGVMAAVQPIKPEMRVTVPENPLEREAGTVPCLRFPERPRASWWMLIGPNGEVFIIGERDVRQRC